MLADVEEEQEQDVICFDDITGKELPWLAVRKATSGVQSGHRRWESRTDEEEHVRNEGRGQQLGMWQEHVRVWGFQLGLSSKNLFHHKENRVSGLTHGDDFVLTGPTKKPMEFERKMTERVSHQSEDHRLWVAEERQNVEQEVALGKARNRVSTRSQTR